MWWCNRVVLGMFFIARHRSLETEQLGDNNQEGQERVEVAVGLNQYSSTIASCMIEQV
jgi:hypothetical protein